MEQVATACGDVARMVMDAGWRFLGGLMAVFANQDLVIHIQDIVFLHNSVLGPNPCKSILRDNDYSLKFRLSSKAVFFI
ncbi:hypothetical protein AB832_01530 [Flavobacteriaceae bacterium (ex Bugula neritina AB1)]|nr:hypothetical protein AB832_01530 [Flavobacteriaceae bacterium (ex Bugula neritina AB1)]